MTARQAKHRFHVRPEQIANGRVDFSAEQAHQIATVLRLRQGSSGRVFDGALPVDHVVRLERVGGTAAVGVVESQADQAPETRTRLVARPALLRRDAFEQVLDSLTQLGVAAIAPVVSVRCVARDQPDDRRMVRWRSILREAAEQSGRGFVPELVAPAPLEQAVEVAVREGVALLAYEAERAGPIAGVLSAVGIRGAGTLSLFVGPEGGFEEAEVVGARRAGVRIVSLGPRILRAETAAPTFLALALQALGEL